MTIKMEQLINARNDLGFFASINLPLKGAYKLTKIKKAVEEEYDYYAEKFQEIIDKYAQRDENGEIIFSEDKERIMLDEDKLDECNDALIELQQLDVEIDTYGLCIEDLGDDVECTPEQLESLMIFME